jgi:hypothetical protein
MVRMKGSGSYGNDGLTPGRANWLRNAYEIGEGIVPRNPDPAEADSYLDIHSWSQRCGPLPAGQSRRDELAQIPPTLDL